MPSACHAYLYEKSATTIRKTTGHIGRIETEAALLPLLAFQGLLEVVVVVVISSDLNISSRSFLFL